MCYVEIARGENLLMWKSNLQNKRAFVETARGENLLMWKSNLQNKLAMWILPEGKPCLCGNPTCKPNVLCAYCQREKLAYVEIQLAKETYYVDIARGENLLMWKSNLQNKGAMWILAKGKTFLCKNCSAFQFYILGRHPASGTSTSEETGSRSWSR